MKRKMTIITCDLCGQVFNDNIIETRKWALIDRSLYPNPTACPAYIDICPSCYEGLVRYISSRRPKKENKNQMTFYNNFPEFVTEEKSGNYFEKLVEADPEPWKNN